MAPPSRRFYLNPYTRFDVFNSGVVVMHYMGQQVKRRRLKDTHNLQIMRAFNTELRPIATGVVLPVPNAPPPEEIELGEETAKQKRPDLREIERRLDKVERDLRRMRRK